jgi:nicotinamidase-related amidase
VPYVGDVATPDYTAPEWERSALVVVDVQNDFVLPAGAMPVDGTELLLPTMAEVAAAFRSAGRPIVHVVRLYVPGGSDVDLPRRAAVEAGWRAAAPGTPGAEICSVLLPEPVVLTPAALLAGQFQRIGDREVVMYKPRWSSFHRTGLDGWLRDLGVTTVVVQGNNLHNCPRATLFDASNHDYRTVLVTDATSQASQLRLDDLRLIGTTLATASQVIAALSR